MLIKKRSAIQLSLLVIIASGVIVYLFIFKNKSFYSSKGIPQPVMEKYDALAAEYSDSFGATLEYCTEGQKSSYWVTGSGGYTQVSYVYNDNGQLINTSMLSDADPLPTVNPTSSPEAETKCTTLKKTKE